MQASKSDLPKVQREVRGVEGVAHARVAWPDPDGPAKLEITLDPGTDEAETTQNVLAVLERVGGVDLRTLDLTTAQRPLETSRARPRFVGLAVERNELDTAVEVTLVCDGRQVTGRAEGPASHQQSSRSTATATLAALREVLLPDVRLEVEWMDVSEPYGRRPPVVQVAVSVLTRSEETLHVGAAFARDDLREATVRATLDAVNRRLGTLLAPEEDAAP